MILEKAYAKLFGSYQSLAGGNIHDALRDLTGCPRESIEFDQSNSSLAKSKLQEWFAQGYLIYGQTYLDQEYEGMNLAHSYSIIDVQSNLIKIRDTYGVIDRFELTNSASYNQDPDEDSITLTFDDFYSNFTGVHCSKIDEWEEIRLPGKFIRVKDSTDPTNDMVLSNYYYEITFATDSNVCLGIH